MKGALAGVVITWLALGALLGAAWAIENYPEISFTVVMIIIITLAGAFAGWVVANDRL